jgi:sulfate permease, SulP family
MAHPVKAIFKQPVIYAALEALSGAVPSGLGAIVWIGFKIGPELIPSLVLALLCGLALVNICGARSPRPQVFLGRFFEISLLAGFIDSFVPKLGVWGLVDAPEVRLTLVMAACVGAALLQPVFYGLRLQSLTRFIPAPVFAGFLNAVALLLLIGQIQQVHLLLSQQSPLWVSALWVGGLCLGVACLVKHYRPHWPAAVLGLLAASLLAMVLSQLGSTVPSMLPATQSWQLPVSQVVWSLLDPRGSHLWALLPDVLLVSLLLGLVVFLNTIVAAEALTQFDDKPEPRQSHNLQIALGQILGACLGSIPMSGSMSSSLAAWRAGALRGASLMLLALFCMLVYPLGLLAWLPQAAMMGLLLFDAYCMVDRASVADMWRCATQAQARQAMSLMQKEDLVIVTLVTLTGALINMVAALLTGLTLGLVLFAKRNGKNPIRDVHDGRTWRSNCVRSVADAQSLEQHGGRIQVVRLQGALYFGVARSLRKQLEAMLPTVAPPQPHWLVLDWHAVVSQDITLARMVDCLEQVAKLRGVHVLHCARKGDDHAYADLDRALEFCENQLLDAEGTSEPHTPHSLGLTLQVSPLLRGLSAQAQAQVQACFETRSYAQGQHILTQGEHSRELHLIAQGRADVMIQGGTIRLAGVSSGAILGEMGFLDGTPRAADVVTAEALVSHVLSREHFEALSVSHPDVAQHMLQNLCTEMASRLRSLHVLISRERS